MDLGSGIKPQAPSRKRQAASPPLAGVGTWIWDQELSHKLQAASDKRQAHPWRGWGKSFLQKKSLTLDLG